MSLTYHYWASLDRHMPVPDYFEQPRSGGGQVSLTYHKWDERFHAACGIYTTHIDRTLALPP